MEGRDAMGAGPGPGPGPGPSGNMQVPFGLLQHRGGSMASPQGGGMSGGPGQSQQQGQGQGQGLHTPAAVRPPPPGMVPPGLSPLPEGGMSGPHPVITMSPGIGVGMGVNVRPVAGSEQPPKRKRGRPRKYSGGDSPGIGSGSPFSPIPITAAPSPYTPSEKRGRGRPPGSGKKQQLAALGVVLAGTGQGFTPHILTVNAGEDVSTKIMQFAQHGPRAMCVMSANGAISNVTLRQQSSSGGTVTYEGRYEILSLSGSYLPTDAGGGARQRTGGLSVSLAGTDGRVIGGGVAGMLMAASPIQVVVGSFLSEPFKTQTKAESPVGLSQGTTSGVTTPTPLQRPLKTEAKLSPGSGPQLGAAPPVPISQSGGQGPQAMGMFQPSGGWSSPPVLGDGRRTDINVSLPGG